MPKQCEPEHCIIGNIGGIEVPANKWAHEIHYMAMKLEDYEHADAEITHPGKVTKYDECPICKKPLKP